MSVISLKIQLEVGLDHLGVGSAGGAYYWMHDAHLVTIFYNNLVVVIRLRINWL